MNQPSDESSPFLDLLAAARAGDVAARNELFVQFQTYLNFVAQQVQQPELMAKAGASDIVQQTLLQATEEFENFRGQSAEQFRGWLRQILINEARTLGRRYHARRRNAQIELPLVTTDSTDSPRELPDSQLTPSSEAMAREQALWIQNCLEKLPEEMRQVIRMRNWDKLQFHEIAEHLGISTSSAAKLWYRALIELQRLHAES